MITSNGCWNQDGFLAGLQQNDPRVIERFYQRLWQLTSRYFLALYGVQYRETLADCFSDAFLILLRKVQSGAYQHRNLDAFAFGIVKNTFRDALRRSRPREQATAPELLPDRPDRPGVQWYTFADCLEAQDHPQLLHWFAGLTSRQRCILDLRFQGYNLEEIAEHTGLAYGTVRNIYSKLLQQAGQRAQAQSV